MLVFKPSTADDLELLKEYKVSGDMKIIGQLFSRYTSLVLGVCLKYLKDREEAKDAAMQIFEKLIQDLKGHDVENFKGWKWSKILVNWRSASNGWWRSKNGVFNSSS